MNEENNFIPTEKTDNPHTGSGESDVDSNVDALANDVADTVNTSRIADSEANTAGGSIDGSAADYSVSNANSCDMDGTGQTETAETTGEDTAPPESLTDILAEAKTGLEADAVAQYADYTEQLTLVNETLATATETLNGIYGLTVMVYMFLLLSWTERRISLAVTNFTNNRKR